MRVAAKLTSMDERMTPVWPLTKTKMNVPSEVARVEYASVSVRPNDVSTRYAPRSEPGKPETVYKTSTSGTLLRQSLRSSEGCRRKRCGLTIFERIVCRVPGSALALIEFLLEKFRQKHVEHLSQTCGEQKERKGESDPQGSLLTMFSSTRRLK